MWKFLSYGFLCSTTPKALSRSHSSNSLDRDRTHSSNSLDKDINKENGERTMSVLSGTASRVRKVSRVDLREDGDDDKVIFGRDYLIPKPFDERLLIRVSCAVAQAAIDSGVARKSLDMEKYKQHLGDLFTSKSYY